MIYLNYWTALGAIFAVGLWGRVSGYRRGYKDAIAHTEEVVRMQIKDEIKSMNQ